MIKNKIKMQLIYRFCLIDVINGDYTIGSFVVSEEIAHRINLLGSLEVRDCMLATRSALL